jgi:type I restriction enzyme S subunit
MYGSIGKLGISRVELTTNQAIAFTNPAPLETKYLFWYLYWIRSSLLQLGKGGTQQNISQTVLKQVPFRMAPLAEQKRIVGAIEEHLNRLDAAVAGLKRVQAQLPRYRATVLKAAVEGRLAPTIAEAPRVRGLPSRDARRPSAGEVEGLWPLPEGWRWLRLDTVGNVLLGRQRAPQYLTGRFSRPYLRVANISEDRIDLEDLKQMDFNDRELVKYRLQAGDILLSEGQSPELVGESAIYGGGVSDLCFQKTLHRFRANTELTSVSYCQTVFKAYRRAGVFRKAASLTVNIAHLTLERIRPLPFPLPPRAESERIVAEVQRRMLLIDAIDREVRVGATRAGLLRQAILSRAFSGQLVPQDPNDEPASVLLDRIRATRAAIPISHRRRKASASRA